jgi:outer membrane protein TolC
LARLLLAVLYGAGQPQALAQAGLAETNTLSLAQARQAAFERNWDLLAAKSGLDAAQAQLLVAKEFPNPTFSYSTAKIGPHEGGTLLGNGLGDRSYDTIFAVNQLIEIGGKRHDRKASAQAGVSGARARFYDARRLLDQGVTKAYLAALLAGENAHILGESARLLQHEVEIAKARLKAGDISDSDEKQIENNADIFALQAKSAEAAAIQARIAVEILLGTDGQPGPAIGGGQNQRLAPGCPGGRSRSEPVEIRPQIAESHADPRPDVHGRRGTQSAGRRPAGEHRARRRFLSLAGLEFEPGRDQGRAGGRG